MIAKLVLDGKIAITADGEAWRILSDRIDETPDVCTGRDAHDGRGYNIVSVAIDGKQRHFYLHRLVAEAFIPNPGRLPTINHIDGNKSNNAVSNLEWCTYSHNMQHAHDNGLINCKQSNCVRCGAPVSKRSKHCKECKNNIYVEKYRARKGEKFLENVSGTDVGRLDDRTRQIINYLGAGLTYKEVAGFLGISKQRIGQIVKSIESIEGHTKMSRRRG